MASRVSRRIIADSDDSDDELSPVKPMASQSAPEMEPLSPQHQPKSSTVQQSKRSTSHPNDQHTSGTTDPSFFTNIYDDQQNKALQQSHLIEGIVRLSQRASASSGQVSLPDKGNGKKESGNRSSATDVTSPTLLSKQPLRKSQLVQMSDATELTTPRKSTVKDEWDVPSSAEGDVATMSDRSSKGINPKTYGKRKRAGPALSAFTTKEPEAIDQVDISPNNSTKKRKATVSTVEDSVVQTASNFYISPSNLSASQKLQYQKIQLSGEQAIEMEPAAPGNMPPPSNHKSSGATTIAYSTPSRYASSGPRPPWEVEQSALMHSENTKGVFEVGVS
jgi:hypothetical protein